MEQSSDNKISVLFVCLGNICRSPMAEGALRDAAAMAGLDIAVDSAGTASYHIGAPPDPRAIAAAHANGVDISGAQARQLSANDFYDFTHIFALDTANLAVIKSRAPRSGSARVSLLLDMIESRKGEPVPDPYYGDDSDFDTCWATVAEATDALIAYFTDLDAVKRA